MEGLAKYAELVIGVSAADKNYEPVNAIKTVSGERSGNTIRIYAYNDTLNRYVLQASDPFLKPDDQIVVDDIDGNGI